MIAADIAAWPAPSIRAEPRRLAAGQRGHFVVAFVVPDGCHVQAHQPSEPFLIATTLQLASPPPGIQLGPPTYPPEHLERVDWTPIALAIYRDTVEIDVPVAVAADALPGRVTVGGRLRYQGCTATACLPPVEQPVEIEVEIVVPSS
jgi:hypothetical protein